MRQLLSNMQPSGPPRRHRAILSGALGIFAGLLTLAWALFGYNLPGLTGLAGARPQDWMLVQVALGFMAIVAGGLMLARFPSAGGALNVAGSVGTFVLGIVYARALELEARRAQLEALRLQFSRFSTATLSLPVNSLVATMLIFAVFPIAILLLISGLGGLATGARAR
jgi:hypothetical protein